MRSLITAVALMVSAAGTAFAAETSIVMPGARFGLAITVYGDGQALVRDGRNAMLSSGTVRIGFANVSRDIVAGSAWLEGGTNVSVLSLDHDFDQLTQEALLRRAVGSDVLLIRTHPQSGEETVETVTLLAAEQGVIVRYRDRIETVPADRIAFRSLPPGLTGLPTLSATVQTTVDGEQPLTLTYLTGGVGWSADYVMAVDEQSRRIAVTGRASVTNTSGVSFEDASLGLVAGRINRIAPPPQPRAMRAEAMAAPAADGALPEREAVADLHLYRLPQPVTIGDRQTRQFTLFSVAELPVTRTYISEGGAIWQPMRGGEPQPTHPRVRLSFMVPSGQAAQPFPQGAARIYVRDSKGELRLVGEDMVPPTPAGGRVDLEPGDAFDITVRRKQTDFLASREPNAYTEAAWQITVDNAKDEAVEVRLIERLAGDWKILSETAPHEKEAADRVVWTLAVPAHGKSEVAYRVRTQR